jgi:hypothetical protein
MGVKLNALEGPVSFPNATIFGICTIACKMPKLMRVYVCKPPRCMWDVSTLTRPSLEVAKEGESLVR